MVSLLLGRSVPKVLSLLRAVDSSSHAALVKDFESYSVCIGLIETGYFRKRNSPRGNSPSPGAFAAMIDSLDLL